MKKILLALAVIMTVISTTSFAAPTPALTVESVSEVTENLYAISPEAESTQLYEEVDDKLIYHFNFENDAWAGITDINSETNIKAAGLAYVNNAPFSFDGFSFRAGGNASITDGALRFLNSSGWNRWRMTYSSLPAGRYTVEFLFKAQLKTDDNTVENFTFAFGTQECPQKASVTADISDWTKKNFSFTVDTDGNVTHNGVTAKPASGQLYFAISQGTATWYVDDLKMYFTPYTDKEYTVTFNANGEDEAILPEDAVVLAGSLPVLTLDEKYNIDDCGASRFVGWAVSADGEPVEEIDVTVTNTLYAVWDNYYYPAENEYLNSGELVATYDFNNVSKNYVSNNLSDLQNFATINTDSKYVTGTTGNYTYSLVGNDTSKTYTNSNNRLFPFFSSGTSGVSHTLADGTLAANAGKDNDLVLSDARTGNGAQHRIRVGIGCTKSTSAWDSKFNDGIYTFAGEVMVEENENIEKVQLGSFATVESTQYETLTSEIPVGEKVYFKKSIMVRDNKVYDYDSMKCFYSAGTGKIVQLAPIFLVTNNKATTVNIHVDNIKVYYNPQCNAPKAYAENAIRVSTPQGIRFMASIDTEIKTSEKTEEYGYLVTRESLLGGESAESLTFEQDKIKYVSGVSCGTVNGEKVDYIYSSNAYSILFTVAVHGLPETDAAYRENLVVRPYIKYDGKIIYGSPMYRSVLSVAKAFRDSGYDKLDDDGKAIVQKILEICNEDI